MQLAWQPTAEEAASIDDQLDKLRLIVAIRGGSVERYDTLRITLNTKPAPFLKLCVLVLAGHGPSGLTPRGINAQARKTELLGPWVLDPTWEECADHLLQSARAAWKRRKDAIRQLLLQYHTNFHQFPSAEGKRWSLACYDAPGASQDGEAERADARMQQEAAREACRSRKRQKLEAERAAAGRVTAKRPRVATVGVFYPETAKGICKVEGCGKSIDGADANDHAKVCRACRTAPAVRVRLAGTAADFEQRKWCPGKHAFLPLTEFEGFDGQQQRLSNRYRKMLNTYSVTWKRKVRAEARAMRARPPAASDPWLGLQDSAAVAALDASAACDSLSQQPGASRLSQAAVSAAQLVLSNEGVQKRVLLHHTWWGLPEAMSARQPESMSLTVEDSRQIKLPDGSTCSRHVLLTQDGQRLLRMHDIRRILLSAAGGSDTFLDPQLAKALPMWTRSLLLLRTYQPQLDVLQLLPRLCRACDVPAGLQHFLEAWPEDLVDADGLRLLSWSLPPVLRVRLAHFAQGALPELSTLQDDLLLRLLLWLDPDGVRPQDRDSSNMGRCETSDWAPLDPATDQAWAVERVEPAAGSLAALAASQAAVHGTDTLPDAPAAGPSADMPPPQRMSLRGLWTAAAAVRAALQWQEARQRAQDPGPSAQQAGAGQQRAAPEAASSDVQPHAGAEPPTADGLSGATICISHTELGSAELVAEMEHLQVAEECGSEPHGGGAVEQPVQPDPAAAPPPLLPPDAADLTRQLEQMEAGWRLPGGPSCGRAARKADGLRLSQRIQEPAVAAGIMELACSFAEAARSGLIPSGEWAAVLLRRWRDFAAPLQLPRPDVLLPEHLQQMQQACDAARRNGTCSMYIMQAACSLLGLMGSAGRASSPSVQNDLAVQAEAAAVVAAARLPPLAVLDTDTCAVCAGTDQPANQHSLRVEAAAKTLELGVLQVCGCSVGLVVLVGRRAISAGFGSDTVRIGAAQRRPQPLAVGSNLQRAFQAAGMDTPPAIGVAHYRIWKRHLRHAALVVACLAVPVQRLPTAPLAAADLRVACSVEPGGRLDERLVPPERSARAADLHIPAEGADGAGAAGAAGGSNFFQRLFYSDNERFWVFQRRATRRIQELAQERRRQRWQVQMSMEEATVLQWLRDFCALRGAVLSLEDWRVSCSEVKPGHRTFLALHMGAAAADGARELRAFHSFAQVLEAVGGAPDQMPLGAPVPRSCKDRPDTPLEQYARDGLQRLQRFLLSIGVSYSFGWEARAARYKDSDGSGSGSNSGDSNGGDSDGDAEGQDAAEARPQTYIQLLFRHEELTRGHTVYGLEPTIRRACLLS